MTGALAPAGSRLIGEWETRPDLVELIDNLAYTWQPPVCANIVRMLARRLDPTTQYLLGSEILADRNVAEARAEAIDWRDPKGRALAAVKRFGVTLPQGMLVFMLFNIARRFGPALQHALAEEILQPLGPALSATPGYRQ